MSTVETKTRYTPEDLLAMRDGDDFELVDGNLVERHMGAVSSWVGGIIYDLILVYCRTKHQGWAWPGDTSYQCFPDAPDKVRKPDVSFMKFGKLPNEEPPTGHIRVAPDLVVEVISPKDLAYEIDEKVEEYLQAGVPLVWVVNPETKTVRIYQPGRRGVVLRETDEIDGAEVLPGFRCRLSEFFWRPVDTSSPSR